MALRGDDPSALLAIIPRLPARGAEIAAGLAAQGIAHSLASRDGLPRASDAVHVDDAFGRLGLWYRLAPTALLGGSFGPVEGHNPWEALHLGAAVLHGPRTANFAGDYDALDAAGAACPVLDGAGIATALRRDLSAQRGRADGLLADAARHVDGLADHLVAMLPPTEAAAGG
jgi:3-deoxy-D-manno-octulosonic-acid transferase